MSDTDQRILKDWVDVEQLAAEFERSTRTIDRWTKEPDGLPFAKTGNTKRFHIPTARDWLLKRMRRPNPRRDANINFAGGKGRLAP